MPALSRWNCTYYVWPGAVKVEEEREVGRRRLCLALQRVLYIVNIAALRSSVLACAMRVCVCAADGKFFGGSRAPPPRVRGCGGWVSESVDTWVVVGARGMIDDIWLDATGCGSFDYCTGGGR